MRIKKSKYGTVTGSQLMIKNLKTKLPRIFRYPVGKLC
jgi:hypothetical protein